MDRDSYRGIVGNTNFLRFWAANMSAELGYGLFELAIVWLAITESHSSFFAGVILFVEFATYSLTFAVGPLIDAHPDKKKFITWIFPVQALLAILITAAVLAHAITVPLILLVVFLMALLWDFPWLAASVILPLILRKEQLLRANSLMFAVGGGSSVLINAMGGIALAVVGVGGASAIYAAAFLLATLLMLTVSVPRVQVDRKEDGNVLTGRLAEGWDELMGGRRSDLRAFFFLSGIQGFFSVAPFLLIAVITAFYLKGQNGVMNFGLLNATLLAGGFAGNFVYGKINPTRRLGKSILASTAVEGILIALTPLALGYLPFLYLLWFAVGSFDPVFYTGYTSYVQATVESSMLGRMKGNIYLLRGTGRGVGNIALGALVAAAGLVAGAVWFGVALVIVAVAAYAVLEPVRNAGYT